MSAPVATGALTDLARQYADVRRVTEYLAARLTPEDQMVQSAGETSPTKWHQAHTTWFFETFLLVPHLPGYKVFDASFRYLFNSYYKRLGGHPNRAIRGVFSRPSLDEVQAYRTYVDSHMARLLDGGLPNELHPLVTLGLNHEQQHQELIVTDIKHAFWTNPLRPAYSEVPSCEHAAVRALGWIAFEGGVHQIGHAGSGFCFDNEEPRHPVYVQPFLLASRLVTNNEYLQFMQDGGYRRPELWLSDGWDRVISEEWGAPLYWEQDDGAWFEFTCGGLRPVRAAEPVCHVSYYEADAFARWAGARLATEQEWEIAAEQSPIDLASANLLDSGRLHPAAAVESKPLTQMFGDAWEWTASAYLPYPGYRSAEGVVGEYNGKFMSGQMVLRGGSCATPASHIRATYRNFFPPQARWQFMGIRLANDGA